MHPILFQIGNFKIYSYGLLVAAGFALSLVCASASAKKEGIAADRVVDLWLVMLVSGVIGARVLYILSNVDYFLQNPLEMVMIQHGGLVIYGAFIFSFMGALVFVRMKKLPFWKLGDIVAPYFALGQAFGRIGCFLNGCCYGKPTDSCIGVHFPDIAGKVWPTQLISSAGLFLIFALLLWLKKNKPFEGFVLLSYLLLYAVGRFLVEFLRGDNPRIALNLTGAQLTSIVVFCIAVGIFIGKVRQWKNSAS